MKQQDIHTKSTFATEWQMRHVHVQLCLYRVVADINHLLTISKNGRVNKYIGEILSDINEIAANQIQAKNAIKKSLGVF